MAIREMRTEECLRALAGASVARLACARDNQPYVVPVSLVYHEPSKGDGCLYGFTTPGQKVDWMRDNPLVCVEVDEIKACDRWVSVIAFGRYEEVAKIARGDEPPPAPRRPRPVAEGPWSHDATDEVPADDDGVSRVWQILKTRPMWWEPGCEAWKARDHPGPDEPLPSIFYRVRIERVSGHEATQDARGVAPPAAPAPPPGRWGWLLKALTRVLGGKSEEAGSTS